MLAKAAFLVMILFAAEPIVAKTVKQSNKNTKYSEVNGIKKCTSTKSGNIRINDATLASPEIVSMVLMEKQVTGDLALYHAHVYDDDHYKDVVKGEFTLHNESANKNFVHYQVILKGSKGLIAKTTGDMIVPAGKNQVMRLGNVPLSRKEISNISSYEIKCISSNIKLHRH